jgi:hypothetical protein
VGNPLRQFTIALVHFATLPLTFDFPHWGERVVTSDLPLSYIPGQLLARLPEIFLLLFACALIRAVAAVISLARVSAAQWRLDRSAALRTLALELARWRGALLICAAVALPFGFLIVQHATMYDGVRHVLFVIPMLAVLAGGGMALLLPLLRCAPVLSALAGGAYVGSVIMTLVALHPLEYIALNALAGGMRGGYGKFEHDYWAVAATVALRELEHRLDYDRSIIAREIPPHILICIPFREHMTGPMLRRPWIIETDPRKADFIIETERGRCARDEPVALIDQVERLDRAFAWSYTRRSEDR